MYKFIFLVLFISLSPFAFADSAHNSIMEFHFGFFNPNIDQESGLTGEPYSDIFTDPGFRFGTTYSFEFFSHPYAGTFSLLSGIDFFNVSGFGRYQDNPDEASKDATELSMIPLELAIVYNLDQLQELFNIPFVFYAKLGLNYNFWWVTDGASETVNYDGDKSQGGKKGWHYGLGIRFLLDFLDPEAATDFDNEYGINSSYLFLEYNSSKIDDFDEPGFKLGGNYWRFGLALQY